MWSVWCMVDDGSGGGGYVGGSDGSDGGYVGGDDDGNDDGSGSW